MKPKRGHDEQELDITGEAGSKFRLILRQSKVNALDFSVILGLLVPSSNRVFRLRRYNGRHEHTNRIENETFYGFHIHAATERYQELGAAEDTYAESSNRYGSFEGALRCLFADSGFSIPPEQQFGLFEGEDDVH
ncbi:MAG: hypothetical protein OXE51_01485 [Gammaproteobacteria bacterium]|nr:hypothetical protein [Gammaproteobacteria bacterium]